MENFIILIIRTCKSENSEKKLERLFKKYYLSDKLNPYNNEIQQVAILTEVCEKYSPVSLYTLINKFQFYSSHDYFLHVKRFLISHLALTKTSNLIPLGYVPQLKIRKLLK